MNEPRYSHAQVVEEIERAEHRLHDEIVRESDRATDMVKEVTEHFDKRLKDTERVLTWRVVAIVAAGTVAPAIVHIMEPGFTQEVAARIAHYF